MNPFGGCVAKLPGLDLEAVLAGARESAGITAGATLESLSGPEDCAVIEPGAGTLLATTDLGPLVGRDLRRAGRIAALHALSDIYACGGTALWALVLLIAERGQPIARIEDVMTGVLEGCAAEGTRVIGGHTATGPEAMAGLTALGAPGAWGVLGKTGARPGDLLMLSKPLGVGLVTRAYRLGAVGEPEFEEALRVMEASNRPAGTCAAGAGARAASDVTGFGFLGHLSEMLAGGLGADIELAAVPVMAPVPELTRAADYRTVWSEGNRDYAGRGHRLTGATEPAALLPLLDPQTNGGLLVAAPAAATGRLEAGGFVRVGTVTTSGAIRIH